MSNDYKPYDDWWKTESNLTAFVARVIFNIGNFETNMENLGLKESMKSLEEWMNMFLLWMEYKK